MTWWPIRICYVFALGSFLFLLILLLFRPSVVVPHLSFFLSPPACCDVLFFVQGSFTTSRSRERSYESIQLPSDVSIEALKERRDQIERLLQHGGAPLRLSASSSSTSATSSGASPVGSSRSVIATTLCMVTNEYGIP